MNRVAQLGQSPSFRKPTIESRAEGGDDPLTAPLLEDAGIPPRQQSTSLNRRNGLVKESSTESYMLDHSSNEAAGKNKYICPTCGESFSRQFNRDRHMFSHEGGVVCEICSETLSRPDHLKQHITTHTGSPIPLRSNTTSGIKITWSQSTHAQRVARGNAQPIPGLEEEEEVEIVELAISYPAIFRHKGGTMTRGPVSFRSNPVVPGNKEAFDPQGRLRNPYAYLEKRILEKREENQRDIPEIPIQNGRSGLRPRNQQRVRPVIPPLPVDRRGDSTKTHQKDPLPFTKVSGTRCHHSWKPPKTKRWPKDLKHAMDIPLDAPKCEVCHDSGPCTCIIEIQKKADLKVVNDGAKGEGVMAFAWESDSHDVKTRKKPLYRKGDIIDELSGDIKDEPGPDYSIEIWRDDLDLRLGKPIGFLYCRDISNALRKINHTCGNPNVKFEEQTVSCKRRYVAVAERDIYSGDWLLADYGPDFWKGRETDCLCGSEKCISLGLKNGPRDGGKLIRPSERMQRKVGGDVANIVDGRSKPSGKRLRQAGNDPSNRSSKRRQQ